MLVMTSPGARPEPAAGPPETSPEIWTPVPEPELPEPELPVPEPPNPEPEPPNPEPGPNPPGDWAICTPRNAVAPTCTVSDDRPAAICPAIVVATPIGIAK